MGGLFLAFPAIFPAGASLIESHEKKSKAKVGFEGRNRGRMAASLDSGGASLGAIGLVAFAFMVWRLVATHDARVVIAAATIAWVHLSLLAMGSKDRALHQKSNKQKVLRAPLII